MDDISKAFDTFNRTVIQFFQEPGLGFYIPLYQREYSWDSDNIDQLMEDICQGVDSLVKNNKEIRFLGTIIKVKENNPRENVNPQDTRAFPTRIDNIIDGQQRISTIALLGSLLYEKLVAISKEIPNHSPFDVIHKEILPAKLKSVLELFAVDLQRGSPTKKPIIIRGSVDNWILESDDDNSYTSGVSFHLAQCIRAIDKKDSFPARARQNTLVGKNLELMSNWLKNVENIHQNDKPDEIIDFPSASEIIHISHLEYAIWDYEREELKNVVDGKQASNNYNSTDRDNLCKLIQLLAFVHYLLDRCCFNIIDPISDIWAFDMFQSLNATGTPLTALETFKPMVVNKSNSEEKYRNSKSEKYFAEIDKLFASEKSASQKTRATDEYLTTFAYTFDGTKLPRRFSSQRQWLSDVFSRCVTKDQRENFLHRMANVATYLREVYQLGKNSLFTNLDSLTQTDKELVTLCILYLRESNHKMAHTILSIFYSKVIRNLNDAQEDFVKACKATTAFYTLWRSAQSNSGLDTAYRQLLKELGESVSWEISSFDIILLKRKYRETLEKGKYPVGRKEAWIEKAKTFLGFASPKICRFALLLVSTDTIPDLEPEKPGLMKPAVTNSTTNYLTPYSWYNENLYTIEHIAPQTPNKEWEEDFYKDNNYQLIGNLILLPQQINSSVSNKNWKTKCIYYTYLAEQDINKRKELAQQYPLVLEEDVINMLDIYRVNNLESIVNIGIEGNWNTQLVKDRSERICEILWDRLYEWLE